MCLNGTVLERLTACKEPSDHVNRGGCVFSKERCVKLTAIEGNRFSHDACCVVVHTAHALLNDHACCSCSEHAIRVAAVVLNDVNFATGFLFRCPQPRYAGAAVFKRASILAVHIFTKIISHVTVAVCL